MSVEENKAVFKTIIEEVFNKGNMSLIHKLIDHNWKYHIPWQKELRGPEGFKQYVIMLRNAYPDVQMSIDDTVGEGDKVAAHLTMRGTFKGKLGELKPTGKRFDVKFAYFCSYKDGKETGEPIFFMDNLNFYQQLGVMPPGFEWANK